MWLVEEKEEKSVKPVENINENLKMFLEINPM